jgi:carotenoid cleavage dioxygenase-like enzyme
MVIGAARARARRAASVAAASRAKAGSRDVETEYAQHLCTVVQGEVPAWLLLQGGTLFRQMGGAFAEDAEPSKAFLDGLAHISAFKLSAAGVHFTNRFMRSVHWESFITHGERSWIGTAAADAARPGNAERLARWLLGLGGAAPASDSKVHFRAENNPNVNIWPLGGGRLSAATEADGEVCAFDPASLATLGGVRTLAMQPPSGSARSAGGNDMVITNAAHWLLDPDRHAGYHCGIELSWGWTARGPHFAVRYVVWTGLEPPLRRVAEIEVAKFAYADRAAQPPASRAAYMHTVAQTANHLVLFLSPMRMHYGRLLAKDFSNGFFGLFDSLSVPTEFIVFRIEPDGALRPLHTARCEAGQSYGVWHLANAFESSGAGRITIDVTCSDRDNGDKHHLRRFEIDLRDAGAPVRTRRLVADEADPHEYEFANCNPTLHMRDYRFVYALRNYFQSDGTQALVRLDLATGKMQALQGLGKHEMTTEPIFVPRDTGAPVAGREPGGDCELDGVVLAEAIDVASGTSDLVIIDAATWTIIARVRAPIMGNVGLHSLFLSSKAPENEHWPTKI